MNIVNRRQFMKTTALLTAGASYVAGSRVCQAGAEEKPSNRLRKAMIVNKPAEEELTRIRDAGFDGVEAGIVSPQEAEVCRKLAERVGVKIHSVLRGWAEFNSKNQAQYDASYAKTEDALRAAQAYGAEAVLLVPCRIGNVKMPRPWEFQIEFDQATGHLTRVVYGDNAPYAEYLKAHNQAIDSSREAVQRLIPLAEKTGVVIALENVWSNLWVKPAVFKHFVASFQSPWVKAYLDLGNHVKYAPAEEWVLVLGGLIAKMHVKDFKLNPADPNGEGQFVNIRDGSIRWPVVREAIASIGYTGWLTIEGGNLTLAQHSERLDLIISGK